MNIGNETAHLKIDEATYLQAHVLPALPVLASLFGNALESFEKAALEENPDISQEYRARLTSAAARDPMVAELFGQEMLRDIIATRVGDKEVVDVRLTDPQLRIVREMIAATVEIDRSLAGNMEENTAFNELISWAPQANQDHAKGEIFAGMLEGINLGSYLLSVIDAYLGDQGAESE